MGVTILDAARRELGARCSDAGEAGDWAERSILGPLADVADHVCRIGDHRESSHYRADKAGALLAAALRLQRETVLGFAGWPEGTVEERTIVEAFDVLDEVRQAASAAAWMAARQARDSGDGLYESDVCRLFDAARRFSCWVEELATTAKPDRWDND